MNFEDFKKEFDSVFGGITSKELVADFEKMGYNFIQIKEGEVPFLQEGDEKRTFSIKARAKIKKVSDRYPKCFQRDSDNHSLLLAA